MTLGKQPRVALAHGLAMEVGERELAFPWGQLTGTPDLDHTLNASSMTPRAPTWQSPSQPSLIALLRVTLPPQLLWLQTWGLHLVRVLKSFRHFPHASASHQEPERQKLSRCALLLCFYRRASLRLMVEVREMELHREYREEGFHHQACIGCHGIQTTTESLQGEPARRGQGDSQRYYHLCSFMSKFFTISSELILPAGLMRQINTVIPFRAQY